MKRTESGLEVSLEGAIVIGSEEGMQNYIDSAQNGGAPSNDLYQGELIQADGCTALPPGCDCVCHQPCHGEGPCYSL